MLTSAPGSGAEAEKKGSLKGKTRLSTSIPKPVNQEEYMNMLAKAGNDVPQKQDVQGSIVRPPKEKASTELQDQLQDNIVLETSPTPVSATATDGKEISTQKKNTGPVRRKADATPTARRISPATPSISPTSRAIPDIESGIMIDTPVAPKKPHQAENTKLIKFPSRDHELQREDVV